MRHHSPSEIRYSVGSKVGSKVSRIRVMVFKKNPNHLWQKPSGLYFFKLGIPKGLQCHYPSDRPGRFKTHIVESLGTHNRAEAVRLVAPLMVKNQAEFRRLSGEAALPATKSGQGRLAEVRAALLAIEEERRSGAVDEGSYEAAHDGLSLMAEYAHEQIERDEGSAAAAVALRKIQEPGLLTLTEALDAYLQTAEMTEQYRDAYRLAVRDLLAFMRLVDCHAQDVGETEAVAFIDGLNSGSLSKGVKKKRISNLNKLWKHMRRRGWPASPWEGHTITEGAKKGRIRAEGGSADDSDEEENVRPFTEAETLRVLTLAPPRDNRQRTYTRGLFRELYALGFTTGMRLNEIVSLRPVDIQTRDERWRLVSVPKSAAKNDASVRTLPVCHPVAVAIIDQRVARQPDPKGRIFSECSPGGPDGKPSWHVSKAMSRERLDPKRLGFGSEVNFHSTRRSFATLMENSAGRDTIGQERYMGHTIPTQLHRTYSGGAGVEKLQAVVDGLRYPEAVERALAEAFGAG